MSVFQIVGIRSLTVQSVAQGGSRNMAPRLAPSNLQLIRNITQSQSLTTSQMAEEAECSERTIKNVRRNLR